MSHQVGGSTRSGTAWEHLPGHLRPHGTWTADEPQPAGHTARRSGLGPLRLGVHSGLAPGMDPGSFPEEPPLEKRPPVLSAACSHVRGAGVPGLTRAGQGWAGGASSPRAGLQAPMRAGQACYPAEAGPWRPPEPPGWPKLPREPGAKVTPSGPSAGGSRAASEEHACWRSAPSGGQELAHGQPPSICHCHLPAWLLSPPWAWHPCEGRGDLVAWGRPLPGRSGVCWDGGRPPAPVSCWV